MVMMSMSGVTLYHNKMLYDTSKVEQLKIGKQAIATSIIHRTLMCHEEALFITSARYRRI